MYLPRMAIHTATGEASRVYSISLNTMTDGCFLRGRGASCFQDIDDVNFSRPRADWMVRLQARGFLLVIRSNHRPERAVFALRA